MGRGWGRTTVAAAMLAVGLAWASHAAPADREPAVGAWQVTEEPAADGAAVVRLRRNGGAAALEIHVVIGRGNAEQLRGATLGLRDCGTGERDTSINPEAEAAPAEMRSQVQLYLDECRASAAEAAALLAGFEPAYSQFEELRREVAARLAAARPVAGLGIPSDQGRGLRRCTGLVGTLRGQSGGRDIHRTPDETGDVIGRLPDGAALVLRATFDGWIEVAVPGARNETGWIPGLGVTIDSASARGYAFPRETSQAVLRSRDGRPLAAHGALEDVIACDGGWVFGRWRIDAADRVDHVREFEIWNAPVRVEAWTPATCVSSGGACGVASAEPFGPPSRPDLRRAAGDWLVESVAEEELSRLTRLSRTGDGFTVEHHISFWHGNAGPYSGASVTRLGQPCGSEEWRRDPGRDVWRREPDVEAAARDLRARLADYFVQCGTGSAEVAAALDGLEPAFAVAAEWAEADRQHVLAVARWIEDSVNPPPDREVEHRIADWRVSGITRYDGSSAVQLDREHGGSSLLYVMSLPPDSPGGQSWSVSRGRCGEADGAELTELPAPALVRERLAALLRACAVPAPEAEAALGGVEPAVALAVDMASAARDGAAGDPR